MSPGNQKSSGPGPDAADPAAMLADGLEHHQSGRLREAEALYRRILEADPNHADANHFLGVLALQAGQNERAIALIGKSLGPAPDNVDALNNLGQAYENQGRAENAAEAYRKALSIAPDFPAALVNLGGILLAAGQTGEAAALLEKALKADPDDPEVLSALGRALTEEGKPEQALRSFERAQDLDPGDAAVQSNLGMALRAAGREDDAIAAFGRAIEAAPDFAEARLNLGLALLEKGAFGEAAGTFEKLLESEPDNVENLNALGLAKAGMETPEAKKQAEKAFEQALAAAPERPDIAGNLAKLLVSLERFVDAAEVHARTLRSAPDSPEAISSFADLVVSKFGRGLDDPALLDRAVESLERLIGIDPGNAEAYCTLGRARRHQDRHQDAIDLYQKAQDADPGYAPALFHLSEVFHGTGRLDDSLECLRKALEIDPEFADAHFGLGMALLTRGQLKEGWEEMEWRWRTPKYSYVERLPQTPWSGEPLAGKTILVWAEQGIGDEIFYASMVPDLVKADARVLLNCDPRLIPLFRRSFPGVICSPREDLSDIIDNPTTGGGPIDYQKPITGLGRWLRPDLESFPDRASFPTGSGFLKSDPAQTAELRARYQERFPDKHLVGISWRSGSQLTGGKRSIPLVDWLPVLSNPRCAFVSLQYGDVEEELDSLSRDHGIDILWDPDIDPFMDIDGLASQIGAMDSIFSIANITLQLAGALGVPTWALLMKTPDWRWMLDRDDSPWFPEMRLFRQEERNDWAGVIERIARALNERFEN